jgi:uncharacterized phage protein (TIGR01671 family)
MRKLKGCGRMRHFKFRVWDIKKEQMHEVLYLATAHYLEQKCVIGHGLEHDSEITLTPSKGIIMQWAGLEDRNGVEIYECDIVKTDDTDSGYIFAVVKWDESSAAFQFHFSDGDILQADDMDMDHVEVIGNIYENPDLLDECK